MKIRQVAQVFFYYKGGYRPVEGEHTDRTGRSRKAFYGFHKFPSSDLQNPDHSNTQLAVMYRWWKLSDCSILSLLNFNFDFILFHELSSINNQEYNFFARRDCADLGIIYSFAESMCDWVITYSLIIDYL